MRSTRRFIAPFVAVLAAMLLLALVLLALMLAPMQQDAGKVAPAPDASALVALDAIADTAARKAAFFGLLRPLIDRENARTLQDRARLLVIRREFAAGESPTDRDRRWLADLAQRYRLPGTVFAVSLPLIDALLERVDAVPQRLVLIQAAKESGWGRSRLSRLGNNLFGQWCFEPGCGIVPARRAAGATHEVAVFADLRAAVRAYLRNLNTNGFYDDLRALRAARREANEPLTAEALIPGLLFYSERREAYLDDLRAMLRQNQRWLPPVGLLTDADA